MSLDHILLGMLRRPASGYDLKKAFEDRARHFWPAELSQIYPTLKRMESRGWLESSVEPSPKGPDRRVYTRTPAGRAELRRWLRGGPIVGTERFAYLAQLFFMNELHDYEETIRFIEELKDRLGTRLSALRQREEVWSRKVGPGFPDELKGAELYGYLVMRLGIRSLAERVGWCEEAVGLLQAKLEAEAGAKR